MKLLDKYILGGFLTAFFSTVVVFSFLMSIGAIFKVIPYLAKGVPWKPVLSIIGGMFPEALSLSIPVSLLVASLLIFGRLSSDGETTAMRASGLSMWQILSSLILVAAVCTIICIINSGFLAPYCHYVRRSAIRKLVVESPVEMIEEGRFITDFNGLEFYVGKKDGNNLKDIRIFDNRNNQVRRELSAENGSIAQDELDILIKMSNVRIDPFFDDKPGSLYADDWVLRIPDVLQDDVYNKRDYDMNYFEIWERIVNFDFYNPEATEEEAKIAKSESLTEISSRLVLAFACLGFVMVGAPLGTQAHRKESSLGILMSLIVAGVYYMSMILISSFADVPAVYPYIAIWIPNFLLFGLGTFLILKNN
ncbi:MAG: LptF/LptG family permease [Kiritimatiellae bacterium]|jgi:lipopolysaccharide export system permease protein|nr:LptF/LptG family permease [Kiritimatiellia bacterium]